MIDYTTENESSDIARCEAPGKCFFDKNILFIPRVSLYPLLFRVVQALHGPRPDIEKDISVRQGDGNRYNHFDY